MSTLPELFEVGRALWKSSECGGDDDAFDECKARWMDLMRHEALVRNAGSDEKNVLDLEAAFTYAANPPPSEADSFKPSKRARTVSFSGAIEIAPLLSVEEAALAKDIAECWQEALREAGEVEEHYEDWREAMDDENSELDEAECELLFGQIMNLPWNPDSYATPIMSMAHFILKRLLPEEAIREAWCKHMRERYPGTTEEELKELCKL